MRRRRGVGTAVIAALAVVLIAVAAGVYLFASSAPGGSSTGSTSTTQMATTITTTGSGPTTTRSSSTFSCPTSASTTTTGGSAFPLNFTVLFSQFSEMAVNLVSTYNGSTAAIAADYHVVYSSPTYHEVNVSESVQGTTYQYSAWVYRNGTATSMYFEGKNYTGFEASGQFLAQMAPYVIEVTFTTPQTLAAFTSPAFVHSTGSSTVTIGQLSVDVTDYAANSLPLSIHECGVSTDFTAFSIQTGNAAGRSQTLLTSLDLAGNFSASGAGEGVDVNLNVTSLA